MLHRAKLKSQKQQAGVGSSNAYTLTRICLPFRWKGENVATTEVADVIGRLDFIQEVNVYGVPVPGMWMLTTLRFVEENVLVHVRSYHFLIQYLKFYILKLIVYKFSSCLGKQCPWIS